MLPNKDESCVLIVLEEHVICKKGNKKIYKLSYCNQDKRDSDFQY